MFLSTIAKIFFIAKRTNKPKEFFYDKSFDDYQRIDLETIAAGKMLRFLLIKWSLAIIMFLYTFYLFNDPINNGQGTSDFYSNLTNAAHMFKFTCAIVFYLFNYQLINQIAHFVVFKKFDFSYFKEKTSDTGPR